jgi:hypothetical protein
MTEQLRTRLRQAADGHVSGIHVPDLVHRAQVSKRRHRYAAAGAGVLAAAVLVGGGLTARAVLPSPDAGPQPANPTGTGSPTGSPTVATEEKWQVLSLEEGERVSDENVRIIREVLDPDGTHIVGDPSGWSGTLSGAENAQGKNELGHPIYIDWRSPGRQNVEVIVSVATGWQPLVSNCGKTPASGNQCRDVELPGGVAAKAIGNWSYAHEQVDGTVIQIMSSSSAGENVSLEDLGISEEQIADLLTNEDLEVPAKRVPIVPGMPVDDARRILLQALGDDAGKYQHESGTNDDGTTLNGAFTGGGTLTVDLDEMTADLVASDGCRPDEPAVCEERTVDGQTVITWSVTDQDPGNFQLVLVEGERQRVYLNYSLPAGGQGALTLDELVNIAADDRWQQ